MLNFFEERFKTVPGHVEQSVMSMILARYHTLVEIDLEIISKAILLPSADSRRAVVS